MNTDSEKILLGVCGGIAAYKAAELVRLLKAQGAQVRVVMTQGATQFIQPLTLQTLSQNPVGLDLLDLDAESAISHIELARWPDKIIVAPATAHFMAKLAHGFADDLLSTLCLATLAPIWIAPAMNQAMWRNPATQSNVECLSERGINVIEPAQGDQACGETGPGRLPEPGLIVETCFQAPLLQGKKIVITAGPTREAIDPVRFISNHSSGKMGYALAKAAKKLGAEVTLISGPVSIPPPSGVRLESVTTAQQMLEKALACPDCDIFIGVAAVADYCLEAPARQKIQKQETLTLRLVPAPDVIAAMAHKNPRPFTIGFAAQTHNVLEYARDKLQRKKLDLIIANDVSGIDCGFNSDFNEVTLLGQEFEINLPKDTKNRLALTIMKQIARIYDRRRNSL